MPSLVNQWLIHSITNNKNALQGQLQTITGIKRFKEGYNLFKIRIGFVCVSNSNTTVIYIVHHAGLK